MTRKPIYITRYDQRRLESLVSDDLKSELKRARIVEPKEVPPDVITMNSRFRLKDLDTNEESEYTLVFPEDEDIYSGKISIYAPMGVALIGVRVGDVIEWPAPRGTLKVQIMEILYQPEAAGDFNL
ncbi:nucleoside diphosphate kinase regulator [bacterium]|nr:nucleoside diphosphate kinase regulator [bacterium]